MTNTEFLESLNGKKVRLDLTKVDGNAFALMGEFRRAARRQGWTQEETSAVLEQCTAGTYDQLVGLLANICE